MIYIYKHDWKNALESCLSRYKAQIQTMGEDHYKCKHLIQSDNSSITVVPVSYLVYTSSVTTNRIKWVAEMYKRGSIVILNPFP
jgi:hypothetical protein